MLEKPLGNRDREEGGALVRDMQAQRGRGERRLGTNRGMSWQV